MAGDQHTAVGPDPEGIAWIAGETGGEIWELSVGANVEPLDAWTFRRVVEHALVRVQIEPVDALVLDRWTVFG